MEGTVIVTRLFKKFMNRLREDCQLVHKRASAMFVSTVALHCPNIHTYKLWFEWCFYRKVD